MTYVVFLSHEAEKQLLSAHEWWLENRRASPHLLLDECKEMVSLLEILPDAGQAFRRTTVPGVRRILFRKSGYWLYYVPDHSHSVVHILAVWSVYRGSDPQL